MRRTIPVEQAAPEPPDELLTVEEAARLLGVSSSVVRASIHRGDIPAERIGRQLRVHKRALL